MLVAVSSSGRSPNIVRALEWANANGMRDHRAHRLRRRPGARAGRRPDPRRLAQLRDHRGRASGLHAPARPVRPAVADDACRRRCQRLLRAMRVAINLLTDDPGPPVRRPLVLDPGHPGDGRTAGRRTRSSTSWSARGRGRCTRATVPASTTSPSPGRTSARELRTLSEHALRAAAAAAAQDRRVQHADGPDRQARARLGRALQDDARLHRAARRSRPPVRLYRRMNYPRTAKVADAIIINSESLRTEVHALPGRRPRQAAPHPRGRRPRAVPARGRATRPGARRRALRRRPGRSCCSSPRCGPTRTATGLLRAFAAAKSDLGDRQLVVVGPGRDVDVRRRAAGPGRASWASPTTSSGSAGFRWRRRSTSTGRADVFVYPSFNETFGLPILEAMACGCPVVTSDTQRDAGDRRRRRPAGGPEGPRVPRRRHRQGLRRRGGAAAGRGPGAGGASSPGQRRPSGRWRCTARSTPARARGRRR